MTGQRKSTLNCKIQEKTKRKEGKSIIKGTEVRKKHAGRKQVKVQLDLEQSFRNNKFCQKQEGHMKTGDVNNT